MLKLDKRKKYLLACSYGPDSMALFSMLKNEGFCFAVAHVNYHLRDESDFEAKSLRKYCETQNISFYYYDVTSTLTKNIEEEAREIRYNFFASVIKENNFDILLVAHNLDDHLETYLLQKKRNILPTYYGIAENSTSFGIHILRPLLQYSKRSLQDYDDENNIPYSIDKTNNEDHYERNKIRHHVLAKMSDVERASLVNEIALENEKLSDIIKRVKNVASNIKHEMIKMSDIEFAYFLHFFVRKTIPDFECSLKFASEVKKALGSKKANIEIMLNPTYELVIEYGELNVITRNVEKFSYTYNEPCIDDNKYFFMNFETDSTNRNVRLNDYPITIRTIDPHDSITINDYKVKATRLLIDWKVPLSLRKRWPVIVNKNNKVIYIPRYQKDFKLTETCNFYVK